MSATGDENQPDSDASVREALRQIGEAYVETARELFKDDPDLCLDPAELPSAPQADPTVSHTPAPA